MSPLRGENKRTIFYVWVVRFNLHEQTSLENSPADLFVNTDLTFYKKTSKMLTFCNISIKTLVNVYIYNWMF